MGTKELMEVFLQKEADVREAIRKEVKEAFDAGITNQAGLDMSNIMFDLGDAISELIKREYQKAITEGKSELSLRRQDIFVLLSSALVGITEPEYGFELSRACTNATLKLHIKRGILKVSQGLEEMRDTINGQGAEIVAEFEKQTRH
jgi:hypothetical protein